MIWKSHIGFKFPSHTKIFQPDFLYHNIKFVLNLQKAIHIFNHCFICFVMFACLSCLKCYFWIKWNNCTNLIWRALQKLLCRTTSWTFCLNESYLQNLHLKLEGFTKVVRWKYYVTITSKPTSCRQLHVSLFIIFFMM